MPPSRITVSLALLAAMIVAVSSPATAATFDVTIEADVIAVDGQTSLREAMALASSNGIDDEIILVPGATYALTDCGQGALVYSDTADLLVIGNGATIQQTCPAEPIIEKTGPNDNTLTLVDLDLDAGPNGGGNVSGHAVKATSQLILEQVSIDGGDAGFGGTLVEIDFGPEAFDLIVRDSMIVNNTGSGTGNLNPAGILVERSSISSNTGNGIGISDGSPIEVVDSTIDDNGGVGIVTSGQGFGLQPDVAITNSSISGNDDGGFFCLSSCRTLEVTDSQIQNNGDSPAAGRGGGITMPIVLAGGATPSVTILNSIITGNVADHPGGGVSVFPTFDSSGPDQPEVSIVGSTVSNNETTCADCTGGGVSVSVGNLTIDSSTVSGNTSTGDGGGVAVQRSSVADVTAPASLLVSQSGVSQNDAAGDGGGLWIQTDSASVIEATIDENVAAGSGGGLSAGGVFNGVLVVSGEAVIDRSTISGNMAERGGGLRLSAPDGSKATLVNSTVDSNAATVVGGGFLVGPTEVLELDHVTVTRNDASSAANIASNGPTAFRRSIVAQPVGGDNCGPLVPAAPILVVPNFLSGGNNWLDDATCDAAADDVVDPGVDPALGEAAENGGATLTRLPANNSPVAGLIAVSMCPGPSDQRGMPRPSGFGCEPGAVEFDEPLPEPPEGFPAKRTAAGDLRIRGTNNSEGFVVTDAGPFVLVAYDADLDDPANDVVTAPIAAPFRDVRAHLLSGDDSLELVGVTTTRNLKIDGDRGKDTLTLSDVNVGNDANVTGGAGDDEIIIVTTQVDRRLNIATNGQDDMVSIFDANQGELRIRTGSGADTVLYSGGVVTGGTDVVLGSGQDRLTLAEVVLSGRVKIRSGRGTDELRVFSSGFNNEFRFTGGAGDDSVTIAESSFDDRSFFNGSGGSDSFMADPASTFAVPPILRSIS